MSSRTIPVFWEKVDALLVGTNLGGEYHVNHRIEIFKEKFFEEDERIAFQKHKLENQRRVKNGEPRKAFDFTLTDLQKDAVDLITVMAVLKAEEASHAKVFAAELLEDIKSKSPDELQKEILDTASKIDKDIYKSVSSMIGKICEYDVMEFYKVCKEADKILGKEDMREQERLVEESLEQGGSFYYLHVPVTSGYQWGEGWRGNEDKMVSFDEESERILPVGKWKFKKSLDSGRSDLLVNGRNEVYLHPMDFTVFAKAQPMEEILSHFATLSSDSFKIGKIDIERVDEVKDMTHREVYDMYKNMEHAIRKSILAHLKKHPYRYDLAEKVYDIFRVENTADNNYTIHHSNEIGWMFTEDLVKQMVKEKVLVEDNKGKLSLNRKEISVENNDKAKTKVNHLS